MALRGWTRLIRVQDIVWLALIAALAYEASNPHPFEIPLLIALGLLQVLEPRFAFFTTTKGVTVSILAKWLLTYVIIGYTGGVSSGYYLLLLLPLLTAATALGPGGSVVVTALTCGLYFSFLLLLDWDRYRIDPDQQAELLRRLTVFVAAGYLTNTLSAANREQSKQYRELAEQLSEANRNLREAEAAMRRSERLVALGQLSAGLAHELRNPLGTIRASSEVLIKNLEENPATAREMAGFISSEVDRTNLIVTRFLDFSRPLQLRLATADVTEIIDHSVQQLERGSPHFDVAVLKNYSPEVAPFVLDADLMERVFYNLLLNAAQATPPGGEITVKTRETDGRVEVTVIDRGAGIDPKHLESIFNPFFTTKPDGVGLGLAIVSKIVDEHGGKMTVESEPGKGSVFRVYLPARRTP